MSQLPALANRQPAANTLAGQQPSRTGSGSSSTGLAGSPLMQRTAQDVVALSKNGLTCRPRDCRNGPMRWATPLSMWRKIFLAT